MIIALGTLILAGATAYLAKKTGDMSEQNREMVEETRRMVEINNATLEEIRTEREDRERPRIIVYVDYDQLPMLYVVIHNVGGSAAGRGSFRFSPHLVRPQIVQYGEDFFRRGKGEVDLNNELNMFTAGYGIKLLPAGAKISLWWGHAEDIARQFYDKGTAAQRVEVEVYYHSLTKDEYPRADRQYREDFVLDPVDVWRANKPAVIMRPPSLNRIVNPIIKAAESITKAIDATGYLKIKTTADVEREHEAREKRWKQEHENRREDSSEETQ